MDTLRKLNNLNSQKGIAKYPICLVLALFLVALLSNNVSAQPPVTQVQQFSEGFVIEPSPTIYIKQNTDYTFNFFLYNISNGLNVGGADVSCLFYLAENQGSLIYSGNPTFTNGYYHIVIDGGNFSEAGHYPYGAYCNSSTMGGPIVGYFEVSKLGLGLDVNDALIYLGGLLALIVIAFMMFYMAFVVTEPGTKLFFSLVGYISMILALGGSKILLDVATLNTGFNAIMNASIFVTLIVFVIVMYFVFINQTRRALELMRAKKGFVSNDDPELI